MSEDMSTSELPSPDKSISIPLSPISAHNSILYPIYSIRSTLDESFIDMLSTKIPLFLKTSLSGGLSTLIFTGS